MLLRAQYNNKAAFIVGFCNHYEQITALLEKIARSTCLNQRLGDKCICFSCEAKAVLNLVKKGDWTL